MDARTKELESSSALFSWRSKQRAVLETEQQENELAHVWDADAIFRGFLSSSTSIQCGSEEISWAHSVGVKAFGPRKSVSM